MKKTPIDVSLPYSVTLLNFYHIKCFLTLSSEFVPSDRFFCQADDISCKVSGLITLPV